MDKESLTRIDETTPTRFSVSQYYPHFMDPWISPLVLVSQVLLQIDLNPRLIKNLWVDFFQGEESFNYGGNSVKIVIDLNIPMDDEWIEHMKQLLSKYLKDAFLRAYKLDRESFERRKDW
jgi:hypothetical protein